MNEKGVVDRETEQKVLDRAIDLIPEGVSHDEVIAELNDQAVEAWLTGRSVEEVSEGRRRHEVVSENLKTNLDKSRRNLKKRRHDRQK